LRVPLIDESIGVTHLSLWCDRPRLIVTYLPVDSLIGKVREVDLLVMDQVTTATVLVNPSSRIHWRRVDVLRGAAFITAHDHIAPGFGRSHFSPVNVPSIEHRLREADGLGHD
jgi:hypothetical protein